MTATSSSSEKTPLLNTELNFLSDGKNKVLVKTVLLAIATGLGAWGGFPNPPAWFRKHLNTEMIQYALVFVLIYQGGSAQNWKLALAITGILYSLSQIK
jgi:hypothetical protein